MFLKYYSDGSIVAEWDILLTATSEVNAGDLTDALVVAIEDAGGFLVEGYPVDTDSVSTKCKS